MGNYATPSTPPPFVGGVLTGITALSALVRDPDPADHPPGGAY